MPDHIPPHPPPPPPPPAALPPPPGPTPAGWLNDPQKGGRERFWDGAAWTDQTRHSSSFKRRFHFSPWWLLALLVALASVWAAGVFDELLVDAGLNAQDCFKPEGEDYVCGSEAQELIEAQENQFIPPPPVPGPESPVFPDPNAPALP